VEGSSLVAIRAHFEKFPATVKGAFVLRSADRDPHQVVLRSARVTELAGAGSQPIDLQETTLDVAPKLDFFVPFEFPVTELGAGWYCLETECDVDGVATVVRPERRFAMAWPRARSIVANGSSVPVSAAACVWSNQARSALSSIGLLVIQRKIVASWATRTRSAKCRSSSGSSRTRDPSSVTGLTQGSAVVGMLGW